MEDDGHDYDVVEVAMPELYYNYLSPPCRAVLLTGRILDINLRLREVNMEAGEHLLPEYIEMCPQHCVPLLDDCGYKLWESRAIMCYLIETFSNESDDTLYPKNPKKRSLVNSRLYFDSCTLYPRVLDYFVPTYFRDEPIDVYATARLEEALLWLDTFLQDEYWIAGQVLTVADIALAVTVSTVELLGVEIAVGKLPHVSVWLDKCKVSLPGFEELHLDGAKAVGQKFKSKLYNIGLRAKK